MRTPLIERIEAFIADFQKHASTFEDANLRPRGIVRLSEALQRLYVLIGDYEVANAAFFDHLQRQKAVYATLSPGETRELTPDEERLMREGWPIHVVLHLRIDAFYVFAKILLDDVGKAIQVFFGEARDLPIGKKHSQMQSNLAGYAEAKGLSRPTALLLMADEAATRIADYRDHWVTHVQNVRAMRVTHFDDSRTTSIGHGMLLPKQTDQVKASEKPPDLLAFIESYVGEVVEYIEQNQ